MLTAQQLIRTYSLEPHPEGGWYRQSYRSGTNLPAGCLPEGFSGDRPFSTAIYFLLEQGNFSAFHRIKSDEAWHFYAGEELEVYIILPDESLEITRLGNDPEKGQSFQYIVPAHCWFASRPAAGTAFSFVGCTVSPGFHFDDFELAEATTLAKRYPQHAGIIRELCR